MIIALTALFFIIAVVMMAIILIQPGSAGGLGFIGGGSQSAFGTKTGNVMTKVTTVLAALFFVSAFALGYLNARTSRVDTRELMQMQEAAEELPAETGTEGGFGEQLGVDISDTNE
jgi:preprotein translocase subunit SecG